MKKKLIKDITLLIPVIIAFLLVATIFQVKSSASTGWTRSLEPVIINMDSMFFLIPPEQVFAYSYKNGLWEQIPLQIDEVDRSGNYVATNYWIDRNDELVFMAKDLGDWAGQGNWIPDADSRNFMRYQIEVTNPLDPSEVGYVYLYRSHDLARTHGDYVVWDDTDLIIATGTYSLTLGDSFIGYDELKFNDYDEDVLDRSKVRISGVCRSGGKDYNFNFSEETFYANGEDFLDLNPTIDGPVRAGGGNQELQNWYYDSLHVNMFIIDFNALDDIVCDWMPLVNFGYIDSFRYSFDWLNPDDSGMAVMTYYDSNTEDGVEIDGDPDSVSTSTVPGWTQASGNLGSIVRVTKLDSYITGWLDNYYIDDSNYDDGTGDSQSYGDSGIMVEWPPETPKDEYGTFAVEMLSFFLDPNQPNIGDTYQEYADDDNALEVNTTSQEFMGILYLPIIFR